MKNGLQNQLTAMGESSCYFLALCKIAEEVIGSSLDVIKAFDDCVTKRYIFFNYNKPDDGTNCFINDPVGCLVLITGNKAWTFRQIKDLAQIKAWKAGDKEFTIQRWYRKATGKEYTHFRRPSWDSLLDSQTVKYGAIDALYIFTFGG